MRFIWIAIWIVNSVAFCQPVPAKLGAMEGRVLNSKTGEPIRRVNITARAFSGQGGMTLSMQGAANYAATTDGEGKFRMDPVEPGRYLLFAERQGFVRQQYGARNNFSMGTIVTLAAEQELKSLEFKMTPHGIITGRVLDEENEPLARANVQVLQKRYVRGKLQTAPVGGAMTNDAGEYRIADLAPGRYLINANMRNQMGMFANAPAANIANKPEEEYTTTYYPAAKEETAAQPLEITAGQLAVGVDIRIQKARVYRIRGKVAGGSAPNSLRVVVIPRGRDAFVGMFVGMFGSTGSSVKDDGSFELAGVSSGSYFVTVLPMQGAQVSAGKTPVDVIKENVDNVILVLSSALTIGGSIQVEPIAGQQEPAQNNQKVTFGSMRSQFTAMEGMLLNAPNASVKDDGSFSLEKVAPDKYRISVYGLPQGVWLKSIRAGDQDVLDGGIDLNGGAAAIQITLGRGAGTVSGTVQDAKQQPIPGSTVTLLPDPMKEDRTDLYKVISTDQNGQFALQGIPPGEYKLFAWGEIEQGSYMDPEFLKLHQSKAKKITVKVNSTEQVQLTEINATPRQ